MSASAVTKTSLVSYSANFYGAAGGISSKNATAQLECIIVLSVVFQSENTVAGYTTLLVMLTEYISQPKSALLPCWRSLLNDPTGNEVVSHHTPA